MSVKKVFQLLVLNTQMKISMSCTVRAPQELIWDKWEGGWGEKKKNNKNFKALYKVKLITI